MSSERLLGNSNIKVAVVDDDEIKKKKRKRSRSAGRYRTTAAIGATFTSPTEINSRVDDDEKDDDSQTTANIFRMSKDKRFTVITFCIANFFIGLFYSILAPFFPSEAQKKEISTTYVGLVFGSFELVLIIVSPFYGTYLNQIGAKFMYITGILVCGVCAILFGLLDKAPNGIIYLVLCLVVRIFEALGAAAFGTASFAMMAYNFPRHVATMFGTLEMFTGLGLMAGPPIGGALYELGGFATPFATLGSMMLVVGFISIFMLSSQEVNQLPREGNILNLLKFPIITITCLCLLAGSCCIGYLDVALAVHLTATFNLSPLMVGLVFLVEPFAYSVMSPIWGRIVDYKPSLGQYFISFGYFMAGLSLFFIGPAPFLNFQANLLLVIICLLLGGLGISTLTITFQIISETTISEGYSDNLSTYGLIAGLVNSFFSIGAFIGPLGGGWLLDVLGFGYASFVIGCITILTALIFVLYSVCRKKNHSASSINVNNSEEYLIKSIDRLL